MTENRSSIGPMVVLSLALVVAAALLAGAVRSLRTSGESLEVTGSAKRTVVADYALWNASITSQSATLSEANLILKQHAATARSYLRANGIADSLVTEKPFSTETLREYQNGNETPRVAGYRLTYRVQVAGTDTERIARLAAQTGDLIDQGVPLVSEPLQYLYTQLVNLRKDLLADATRDAKERAESIAGAAGASVGRITKVRVGVFQVTPRFSTEVSDYGVNDVSTKEKDVTAVVRAEFALN